MSRLTLLLPLLTGLLIAAGLWGLASVAPDELGRQLLALGVALTLCAFVLRLGPVRLMAWRWGLYFGALLLLLLVRVAGTEVNGARSWLALGPLPAFQPSELVKLALLLALPSLLARRALRSPLDYLAPLLATLLPVGLILLEPDLGSALVIVALGLGLVLVRGVPRVHLLFAGLTALVLLPGVVWPNLEPHQRARLVSFLDPGSDPLGSGYQVIQARIAVGAGGLWGQGHGAGTQTHLGFVPYPATDFIFSVLAEEGGFFVAGGLLILYGALFATLALMAQRCSRLRDHLLITGVLLLVGVQALVNLGMALGLAPVTGITLPLVSYGGSSLLTTLLALTTALLCYRQRHA